MEHVNHEELATVVVKSCIRSVQLSMTTATSNQIHLLVVYVCMFTPEPICFWACVSTQTQRFVPRTQE